MHGDNSTFIHAFFIVVDSEAVGVPRLADVFPASRAPWSRLACSPPQAEPRLHLRVLLSRLSAYRSNGMRCSHHAGAVHQSVDVWLQGCLPCWVTCEVGMWGGWLLRG